MTMTLRMTRLGVLAMSLFVAATSVQAQEFKNRTVRINFQNTSDHPVGLGLQRFADIVKAKTNGKINVRLFSAGQLGGDMTTVSALQGGTIDMTVLNTGVLAPVEKNTAIFDFPYLFNNEAEADAVVDGPAGKKIHDMLVAKNLIGLAYFENSFRQTTNTRRPITKLEDFAGLKLRILQLPLFIDVFRELGVNPLPLPFPELYTALEQKVVDGQENPPNTIYYSKIHEVQKYLSLTNHVFNPQSLLISKKTWDAMSPAEKDVISQAAKEAAIYERKESREQTKKSIDLIRQAGVAVNEIPPAEIERIRQKVKPVVDKYSKEIDPELVKLVDDSLAKVRGK
ncbi:TRAP transporter substrate-binding protein [Xanthobacteraceae bacterium Astr-EGSB]|uniref:TRAP transporter substrate-binding protein n=1 Tax=Astrobacterium formosum TaxID=3069710 RepID=UPI0027B6164B|nr:TRAP transporter substrate-binding protein [Xanthobacteraceae bacterium Astr-EGSB]